MLLEHPEAELPSDFSLAYAFDDIDPRSAKDANALAVDARMRVAHADNDTSDSPLGDGSRARWGAAVERARLQCRVEGRARNIVAACVSVSRSGHLSVILSRSERVAATQELATLAHDDAADPRVVTRSPV